MILTCPKCGKAIELSDGQTNIVCPQCLYNWSCESTESEDLVHEAISYFEQHDYVKALELSKMAGHLNSDDTIAQLLIAECERRINGVETVQNEAIIINNILNIHNYNLPVTPEPFKPLNTPQVVTTTISPNNQKTNNDKERNLKRISKREWVRFLLIILFFIEIINVVFYFSFGYINFHGYGINRLFSFDRLFGEKLFIFSVDILIVFISSALFDKAYNRWIHLSIISPQENCRAIVRSPNDTFKNAIVYKLKRIKNSIIEYKFEIITGILCIPVIIMTLTQILICMAIVIFVVISMKR